MYGSSDDTRECQKHIGNWLDCTPWYMVLVCALCIAFTLGCLSYFVVNLIRPLDSEGTDIATHNGQIKTFIGIATVISFAVLVGLFFMAKTFGKKKKQKTAALKQE